MKMGDQGYDVTVVERYGGAYWSILMPKNALCFDHLNPENGDSKLDNVGNFFSDTCCIPWSTAVNNHNSRSINLGRSSRSVARM